jgi:hypothetical protein
VITNIDTHHRAEFTHFLRGRLGPDEPHEGFSGLSYHQDAEVGVCVCVLCRRVALAACTAGSSLLVW